MSKKSFEDELKSKVDSYATQPKADLWEQIDAALPPEEKKRKRFLPIAIIIAASLGGILLSTYINPQFEENKKLVIEKTVDESIPSLTKTNGSQELAKENRQELSPLDLQANKKSNIKTSRETLTKLENRPSSIKRIKIMSDNVKTMNVNSPEKNYKIEERKLADALNETNISSAFEIETIAMNSVSETKEDVIADSSFQKLLVAKDSSTNPIIKKSIKSPWITYVGIDYKGGQSKSYLQLQSDSKGNPDLEKDVDDRKNEYKGKYSFQCGLVFGLDYKRHQFRSGLKYTQIAYKIPVSNINSAIISSGINTFGRFDYSATDSFKFLKHEEGGYYVSNQFTYLSIPISYGYTFFQRKHWNISSNVSLISNLLLNQKGIITERESGLFVKQDKARYSDTKKHHFTMGANLTIMVPLNKRLNVYIIPEYRQTLTPIEGGKIHTGYRIWNLGAGLLWKIN